MVVTQSMIDNLKEQIAVKEAILANLRARKAGKATMDGIRQMAEEDRQTAIAPAQPMQQVPAGQFPMDEPQGYKAVEKITGAGWQPQTKTDRTQTIPELLGAPTMLEPRKDDIWGNAARTIAGLGISTIELPRKLLSHSVQDKKDALNELSAMLPNVRQDVRASLGEIIGPLYDAVAAPLGDTEAHERNKATGFIGPAVAVAGTLAPFTSKIGKAARTAEGVMRQVPDRPAVSPTVAKPATVEPFKVTDVKRGMATPAVAPTQPVVAVKPGPTQGPRDVTSEIYEGEQAIERVHRGLPSTRQSETPQDLLNLKAETATESQSLHGQQDQLAKPVAVQGRQVQAVAPEPIKTGTLLADIKTPEAQKNVDALRGEKTIPKAEPEPQGKLVSLKKAEGAEIRKRMHLDELDPVERQTFEDSWDNVAKSGKAEDALNIARDVIENGRQNKVMDDHTALLQKSIEIERTMDEAGKRLSEAAKRGDDATVTSEMARILNLNEEMDLVTRASDMMGTEAGRGLSVRRMRADKESLSLAHVLQTARTNKGRALQPHEVVEFENSVKRIKDLEAENAKLAEISSRVAAERDRAVAERVTRVERQRVADPAKKAALKDNLAAERANLEKQLAAMGNQMNAVVGPPTEAMHIMGKLAANYIKEGAASLDDVVASIKKKFPNVTDRDVWEALQARSPEAQAKAKKVVERNLSEFKKQARLLTEIDNLEKGITEKPTNPLSKSQEAARTKELRKRLTELRKSLYESESLPADRLEAAITTLNELQNHLANKTRPPKKGAPEIPAEVKPIKDQISALRRQMKAEDVLTDLNQQLETGEFKVTAKKQPFTTPELERNQILVTQARRQLRERLEAQKPMTVGRRAGAVVSGLREVAATADVSGTLRQGLVLTARRLFSDPVGLVKRNADAFKALANKYSDEQIHNALKNDPQYADAVGDGLRLAEKGGEELYHSPLVEKIPGFGKLAQMSERHMRTYLNVMRWDAYKKFRQAAPNATKAERAAISRSLNVMSGYGDMRSAPDALRTASKVFFAPRFAVSRFQTPKLILDYWKEPRVRKEIAKNYAATAAFGASVLAMAKLMGGEVGDDPRSADFGKARFGDTRIDLWGGFQQPMRLLFRLGMVGTDRVGLTGKDLNDREKDQDPFDLVSQFAVYKLAPHVTLPVEMVRGKTVIGQKTQTFPSRDNWVDNTAARTLLPFLIRDVMEAYKEQGVGTAVATGLVSAVGGGVGTYPDSETATRIKARRLIAEKKGAEAQQILAEWNKNNPKNKISNP